MEFNRVFNNFFTWLYVILFHSVSAHSKRCLNEGIHLDQTMKIVQLYIYLLMWSQASESLTNTAVTLGADVIIGCDLDIEEIYWYRQKSPDPPVLILRTYDSTYEGAEYENNHLSLKYSVKTNSLLFIRNISTDELGVYYCVKTSEPQKFSNGTKIYINGELFSHFRCTVQVKSLETLLFLTFLKEVSSAHQACIYLIKNTEKQ
uniref:Ig-like domain-containing protein n=1 Tax=Cyprinus carpio carpio TaxID=630221 RepID=A0A9J8CWJ3_CYPCA